jgi:hypothetical protein
MYFRFNGRHIVFPTSGYIIRYRGYHCCVGDNENMGGAVEIVFLSTTEAEKQVLPV